MSPTGHVLVSVAAGGVTAAATGVPAAGLACAAAGILIDLDHVLDYLWFARGPLRIKDFRETCEETRFTRLLLLLHSWELLAALWAVLFLWLPHPVLLGLVVGLTLHLLGDQAFNEPFPLTYFLAYRLAVGLDATRLFRPAWRRQHAAVAPPAGTA